MKKFHFMYHYVNRIIVVFNKIVIEYEIYKPYSSNKVVVENTEFYNNQVLEI